MSDQVHIVAHVGRSECVGFIRNADYKCCSNKDNFRQIQSKACVTDLNHGFSDFNGSFGTSKIDIGIRRFDLPDYENMPIQIYRKFHLQN